MNSSLRKVGLLGLLLAAVTIPAKILLAPDASYSGGNRRLATQAVGEFLARAHVAQMHTIPLNVTHPDWLGWHFRIGSCGVTAFAIDDMGQADMAAALHAGRGDAITRIYRGRVSTAAPVQSGIMDLALFRMTHFLHPTRQQHPFYVMLLAAPGCAPLALPWADIWK